MTTYPDQLPDWTPDLWGIVFTYAQTSLAHQALIQTTPPTRYIRQWGKSIHLPVCIVQQPTKLHGLLIQKQRQSITSQTHPRRRWCYLCLSNFEPRIRFLDVQSIPTWMTTTCFQCLILHHPLTTLNKIKCLLGTNTLTRWLPIQRRLIHPKIPLSQVCYFIEDIQPIVLELLQGRCLRSECQHTTTHRRDQCPYSSLQNITSHHQEGSLSMRVQMVLSRKDSTERIKQ